MAQRSVLAALLAFVVSFFAALPCAVAYVPPPIRGAVNDGANMLTEPQRVAIEGRIAEHRKAHGHEIVVLTVASLGGESVEDVAYGAFNGWKIGRAGKDDGVLLVVAPTERKTRIETGKGVGGAITDLQSKRILSERVGPRLKEGKSFEGIRDGVESIASLLLGGPLVPDGGVEVAPSATATSAAPKVPTPTYAPTSIFVDGTGTFPEAERARYLAAAVKRVRSGNATAAILVVPDAQAELVPAIAGWNKDDFRKKLDGVCALVVVSRSGREVFAFGDMEIANREEFENAAKSVVGTVAGLPPEKRDGAMIDVLVDAQSRIDLPLPSFFSKHGDVIVPFGLIFGFIGFFVVLTWILGKLGIKMGGGGGGSSGGGSSYSGGGSSHSGGSSYSGGGSSSGGGGYSGGGGSSGGGGASDSY